MIKWSIIVKKIPWVWQWLDNKDKIFLCKLTLSLYSSFSSIIPHTSVFPPLLSLYFLDGTGLQNYLPLSSYASLDSIYKLVSVSGLFLQQCLSLASLHNANTLLSYLFCIFYSWDNKIHVHLLSYTHTAGIPLSVLASSFSNPTPPHPPFCLIYLPLKASAAPPWLPTIRALHPSGGVKSKIQPFFPAPLSWLNRLSVAWLNSPCVLLFCSWTALLNF